ncbi:MAG: sigma-70 family RNA polymerase sigma factor [Acidobacteria bacterium]|nr:sigma-70 family RNA polymerase sigma factor [Acidobacteriota bacterium]
MAESVTRLLVQWEQGDQAALDHLIPLVYGELRRLARSYLRRTAPNQTLQPSDLVHEAFLALVEQENLHWENRAQFFGLAATLMRRILVDHARRRHAAKRGGGEYNVSLSEADRLGQQPAMNLLLLDDALQKLASFKPQHSRVVELRFFGGLTIAETAAVLGISHATVERDWNFARAWLHQQVSQ